MPCPNSAARRARCFCFWSGLLIALAASLPAAAQSTGTTVVYPPWSHCYGLHRVNQKHLTLRAGFRARFDDPQGMAAIKLVAEDDPTTGKDDDELTVFGVNSGEHMLIYNTSLTAIAFYGREGDGPGQFRRPHGIAANRAGDVVVADTGNDRLHVLRYVQDALTHVRFIAGDFNGRPLRRPLGVALEAGEIYVCDPDNDRVLVLDLEGKLRRELRPTENGAPVLKSPFAVAAIRRGEENNYFGEDFVAVTDSGQTRIWRLHSQSGLPQAVRRLDEVATSGGEFYYVAIDYYANVYCSDRVGGRLHKFDRDFRFLLSIGRSGRGDLEFDAPRGIGLYRRFGQIFLAEREGAQYLWIGTDVFTPTVQRLEPAAAAGEWQATLRFFLTEYAQVGVDLVDPAGTVRTAVVAPMWMAPGPIERRVRFATAPEPGLRLRIEAIPTYSSRKVLRVDKRTAPLAFSAARP